jgi:hypothetical protein
MRAYCDGSGNVGTSDVVVLAGVAADESVWRQFEPEWDRILKDRDPVAPYLHMNEVASGAGAFRNKDGWNDTKRESLVRDCLMYAQKLDKQLFRTFVSSVEMPPYRRLKQQHAKFPSIPMLSNKAVAIRMFRWYIENFSNWKQAEIYYFFDQNEIFASPFKTLWQRRQRKTRRGLYNPWDLIKNVETANMRFTPQLQFADLIAWAHHRKLTPASQGQKWSELHVFTDAVLPFTRRDYREQDLLVIAQFLEAGTTIDYYFNDLTLPDHFTEDELLRGEKLYGNKRSS